VLIAIGILGTGLAMVAAVFPAGAQQALDARSDAMASLICQNALALTKLKVKHSTTTPPFATTLSKPPGGWLGSDVVYYPQGTADTTRGMMVLGRQIASGKNDYQLVLLAFEKHVAGSTTCVEIANCTIAAHDSTSQVTFPSGTNMSNVQIGSPVIVASDGSYATIVAKDDSARTAILSHSLEANTGISVHVVREVGAAESPCLGILVTRTSLKE